MPRIALIAAVVLAAWSATPAQAEDATIGGLKISVPWARATPKGAGVGGGYMTITNAGTESDRLIGGSTEIARGFEVHEMTMDGGVMKMRAVADGIEIKPGQTVTLDPSGYHIMLVGLKEQLKQGDHFKATLQFAKAGKVDVDFAIEGIGATTGGGHDHTMPGMGGMHMK